MLEQAAPRDERLKPAHRPVGSEFKEDTFGESTLNVRPDSRGDGGSVRKNISKVTMRANQYPVASSATKIELTFLASAQEVDQKKLIEREIFENLSVRKSTSSSNR